MEMGQTIHFRYQILPKMLIFFLRKWQKITSLGTVFFFQFFNLGNILENFDQSAKNAKKVIFWQKIMFVDFFCQDF